METMLAAVYDTVYQANAAAKELVDHGFNPDRISLVANDAQEEYRPYIETKRADEGANVGAGVGAVIGGLSGLLIGLGAFTLPGIGPIVAAGPLAAALGGLGGAGIGAVTGSALGSLAGALVAAGVSEEDAYTYAESVRRGRTLLLVQTPEEHQAEVRHILNEQLPVNMLERSETGGTSRAEHNVLASPYTRSEFIQDQARHQRPAPYTSEDDYEKYQGDFLRHYSQTYGPSGISYRAYTPAYEYGFQLAQYTRYAGWDWDRLEPEARTGWEQRHDLKGDWEYVKDAVHYGWARARGITEDV